MNCINCFLSVTRDLKSKQHYFDEKYEIQPVFKAGIHYGHVISGEMGIIKREIAYSGDVLNTTARIQSKCNELGVDILISEALVSLLHSHGVIPESKMLGTVSLRGKSEKLKLYTI